MLLFKLKYSEVESGWNIFLVSEGEEQWLFGCYAHASSTTSSLLPLNSHLLLSRLSSFHCPSSPFVFPSLLTNFISQALVGRSSLPPFLRPIFAPSCIPITIALFWMDVLRSIPSFSSPSFIYSYLIVLSCLPLVIGYSVVLLTSLFFPSIPFVLSLPFRPHRFTLHLLLAVLKFFVCD